MSESKTTHHQKLARRLIEELDFISKIPEIDQKRISFIERFLDQEYERGFKDAQESYPWL